MRRLVPVTLLSLCSASALAIGACDQIAGIGAPTLVSGEAGTDGEAQSGMPDGETTSNDATINDAGSDAVFQDVSSIPPVDGSTDSPITTDANACIGACTPGATQCTDAGVETCAGQDAGCAAWAVTSACSPGQACTFTEDAGASCACALNACGPDGGTACENAGAILDTCSVDSKGCAYVSASGPCPSGEFCSGQAPNAACSSTCTPSCTSGQTECVTGGLATCTSVNNCLEWGAAVACGPHQQCQGAVGSAQCTCAIDPVCQGAASYCENGTLVTCTTDSNGCAYQQTSQACSSGACEVSGSTASCCAQACNGTCATLDTVHGIFVSASSTGASGCGPSNAPCPTIAAAIAAAPQLGIAAPVIYLDKGNYPEQVTLINGVTLRGGWTYASGTGTWTKDCFANANGSAVIAPTSGASVVVATGVTAALDTLTIQTKPTANAGESLYGVIATGGTTLTMTNVVVTAAAGGAGSPGSTQTPPAGPQPPCAGSDGKAASSPGANGSPTAASYSSTGYAPGNGTNGGPGNAGDDGVGGGSDSCAQPTPCANNGSIAPTTTPCAIAEDAGPVVCSGNGTSGCGGPGGAAGSAGGGGGASVALYVWGSVVQISGGQLTAGNGGAGGAGGVGGPAPTAWSNSGGAAGSSASYYACAKEHQSSGFFCLSFEQTLDGGTTGGAGGAGSAGGAGASGSGGDSFGYYVGGGGSVTGTFPTPIFGTAGTSPGPVAGAPGNAGAHN